MCPENKFAVLLRLEVCCGTGPFSPRGLCVHTILEKRVVLLILSSLEYLLCFELDLPDPLLRNIQLFTEHCEGSRFMVVQPVPAHQYILGSLR